jgi:hypothetical protein
VPFDIYGTIDNFVQQFLDMVISFCNIVYSVYSFGLNIVHAIAKFISVLIPWLGESALAFGKFLELQ